MIRRMGWVAATAIVMAAAACGPAPQNTMKEIQRTKSGALEVVLLAPSEALRGRQRVDTGQGNWCTRVSSNPAVIVCQLTDTI